MFSRLRNPTPVAAALLQQLRPEQLAQPALQPRIDLLEAALQAWYGPLPKPPPAPIPALDLVFDTAWSLVGPQPCSERWSSPRT